jgi:hypothetical protein
MEVKRVKMRKVELRRVSEKPILAYRGPKIQSSRGDMVFGLIYRPLIVS